eukprot:scaffold46456_cov57-Phaeocystis_antarctica.AAC.4
MPAEWAAVLSERKASNLNPNPNPNQVRLARRLRDVCQFAAPAVQDARAAAERAAARRPLHRHRARVGGRAARTKCPLGSAPARLLRLLRAPLVALGGS